MPVKSIDVKTLKNWLEKGEAAVIDVREPAEHEAESIPGAALIPLGTISTSSLPEFTGKKLVLHCRAGKRGETACEKLIKENPDLEVYNLEGGISSWTQAGYGVISSGKFFLPLDRQVQLTIGLLLVAGSVLTYFMSPLFVLLTGFLGVGLTIAGLTGFCGLALLMARMPWNQKTTASGNVCFTGK